jgi:hemolysin activation/secretion protein
MNIPCLNRLTIGENPGRRFQCLLRRTLLPVTFLAMLLPSSLVLAAPSQAELDQAAREADRIQQLEQLRLRQEREEALRRAKPESALDPRDFRPEVKPSGRTGGCRDIKEVVLKGVTRLSDAEQLAITAPRTGKCLSIADIEALLGELTKAYIDKGYIAARVYVPQQDMSSGKFELLVVEGIVEKNMIKDGDKGSVSVGNTFPGVEGGILNLRDIEQGLDQINRLSSNNAKMSIEPGEKEGGSTIVITNEPRSPLHFNLSYDNQGSQSTGKHQVGVTMSFDNPLGLNDFISVSHREAQPNDRERKYSASDSFNYVLPYGYNTFTLGKSRSNYVSIFGGVKLSGNSTNSYLKADRVMYRDQFSRVSAAATLTTKEIKTYSRDAFSSINSRSLTVLDVGATLSTQALGGALGLDLGYGQGLDTLGALTDPAGLPDSSARAQFGVVKFGVMYNRSFPVGGKSLDWSSQFSSQRALDTLYGSEQFSIGGISTVRGFVSNSLASDHGSLWRNELSSRFPIELLGYNGMVKPYVAIDHGRVSQRGADNPSGKMTGAALGFTFAVGPATWEWFVGAPVSTPDSMPREGRSSFFRVSVAL